MLAYRNINGQVIEIQVDVDETTGLPMLPPDTTVDEKPIPLTGNYVTVVGNTWVQIPITVQLETFESNQLDKLNSVNKYKTWLLEQPVPVGANNILFDGDEMARARLTQALTVNSATGYLPPAWITYNNSLYPISALADLVEIVATISQAFSTRFTEAQTLKGQIAAATTQTELDAIDVPNIPMFELM